MHPTRPTPSESGQHLVHDTIYCEAACPAEEVFYEGSEDDDYDSPTTRRLRYEAAGQRFLDGGIPLILSATLKGPFDKASGWVNPWRSRRNNSGRISASSRGSKVTTSGKENRHPQTRLPDTQDSLQCHLPSPESLKQESLEPHPFLEDGDVARVHDWRSTVQPMDATKDVSWVDTASPSLDRVSTRKKRATSSGQRQVTPSKRRKTDPMSIESIQTAPNHRSRTGPVSSIQASNNTAVKSSFTSSSSIGKSSLRRQASYSRQDDDELGAENEIVEAPNSSFVSSSKFSSPSKRVSPKRDVWKNTGSDAADSEDELAQDKAANLKAAATLSSPVSIKGELKKAHKSMHLSGGRLVSHRPQTMATKIECHETHQAQLLSESADVEDSDTNMTNSKMSEEAGENPPDLETHRDDSFCIRMQPKLEAQNGDDTSAPIEQRQSSPLSSVSSSFDSKSWSGLSSSANEEALSVNDDMSTQSSDTSDTSGSSDTSEGPEHGQLQNSDSIVVDVADHPTEEHSEQADEAHTMMPDDDTSSDTSSSELSDPSTVESTIEPQLAIVQEEPGNEFTPGVAVDNVSTTPSEAQSSHVQRLENDNSTSPRSDSCESREDLIDLPMEDVNEPTTPEASTPIHQDAPQDPALQSGGNITTIGDILMADSEFAGPVADGPPPVTKEQAFPLVRLEDGCGFPEPAATPEITSTGFSLKNGLQRLVAVKSWRGSQSNDLEGQEQATTNMGEEYEEHEQTLKSPQPIDDSSATRVEGLATQAIHATGGGATLKAPVSHSTSDTLAAPGSQYGPDCVQKLNHKICSPPQPDKATAQALKPAESTISPAEDSAEKEETNDEPITLSQQSTWSKSQGTQWLSCVLDPTATLESVDDRRAATLGIEGISTDVQTPFAHKKDTSSVIHGREVKHASSHYDDNIIPPVPAVDSWPSTPPRPSTPESQSTLQPFSAFMTPSPEHRARKTKHAKSATSGSRLPSMQRILASAMKNPWRSARSSRRVSWATLPGDKEQESPSRGSGNGNGTSVGIETKERAASPPPTTAVEHLPTSKDDDFQGHFNAVAKRANEAPRTILSTQSQETNDSSDSYAMVEDPLSADAMGHAWSHTTPLAVTSSNEEGDPMAEDDMDLTEQVFQDLEDLLRPWDLDAELDQAHNKPEFGVAEVGA